MKTFRSLVVVKRPQQELWAIMRDHLVDFGDSIADIESIREIERTTDAADVVHVVNEWRISQQVSASMRAMLKIEEFSWLDRNSWNAATATCSWIMQPRDLAEYITCSGTTAFSPAMGGRGTRVEFAGELDLRPGLLGSLGGLETMASGFVETTVTTIVPRNLRAVVEKAAEFGLP